MSELSFRAQGSPLPSIIASRCFVVLAFLLLPPFAAGSGFSAVEGPPPPASESIGVPTAEGFVDGSSKSPSPSESS